MAATRRGAHRDQIDNLLERLSVHEADNGPLPGIVDIRRRRTLIDQMVSSLRRIEYINTLQRTLILPDRADPMSYHFDPLKGAVGLLRKGEIDEAIWLTFLATHFGKHLVDGWKLSSNVMSSFGQGPIWTAERYSEAPEDFERMLMRNQQLLNDPKSSGRFSNHRQYQSKKAGTIAHVFRTFHVWQFAEGGFAEKTRQVHRQFGQEPKAAFDGFYRSMKPIFGFGRLGNFDFLTMIGKLQLAPIIPGSVYLLGATGPLAGAKLLFHGNRNFRIGAGALGPRVDKLDDYLSVGKQVLEDSLCNWQKNPEMYVYFRG